MKKLFEVHFETDFYIYGEEKGREMKIIDKFSECVEDAIKNRDYSYNFREVIDYIDED